MYLRCVRTIRSKVESALFVSNHQLTPGRFRSLLVWTPLKSTIWNVIEDNVQNPALSRQRIIYPKMDLTLPTSTLTHKGHQAN